MMIPALSQVIDACLKCNAELAHQLSLRLTWRFDGFPGPGQRPFYRIARQWVWMLESRVIHGIRKSIVTVAVVNILTPVERNRVDEHESLSIFRSIGHGAAGIVENSFRNS